MKAKVSIVVPSYNQRQYLAATLDHIMFQDYPNLEIIVTDDASTDGTQEMLREYGRRVEQETVSYVSYTDGQGIFRTVHRRYPEGRELRLVFNDRNVGATANYNRGLRLATGEFVTFIAGDDLPHPSMVSTLVQVLESGADFAYADMFIVDDVGRILRRFALPDFSYERSLCDWYLLGVCKLWRRSLHDRVGYFDERYRLANDYDLFLRFAQAGARMVHVAKVLYSVRWHGPDRKIGLHTPENEDRLIRESIEIALRARRFCETVAEDAGGHGGAGRAQG